MRASYPTGALPLRPWDLAQLRQNGCLTGRLTPPRPFRPLSRRSGRIPALPYPPLRCFQRGSTATPPTMLLHLTAITPLTSCRTPGVHFNVLLGPRPSLPYLRRGLSLFVRQVHRYYGAVRLLCNVPVRCTAICLFGPVSILVRSRGSRGLPVLVHVVSQRARVLRLRRAS
jgi:hypothetical protein